MFNWPKTSESQGVVTVTGRHWTPRSENFAEELAAVMLVVTMLGCGYAYYHYQTYQYYRLYQHQLEDVRWLIFVSCLVGCSGIIPGVVVWEFTKIFYAIFLRPRTTVLISTDVVKVAGTKYQRGNAVIQFTNFFPSTSGSIEETAGLRMFYGGAAVQVTTFKTPEKAGKFALACNAALQRAGPPAQMRGFGVVSVSQLYQSGQVVEMLPGQTPAALPPPGTTRRLK